MMLVLARLTLLRALRGRAVWVSAAIAAFPAFYAMATRRSGGDGVTDLFVFEQILLAIIPAMFIAASLGEEIEDRTTTYLWSRPLSRGTVLAGKLVALVPVSIALTAGAWVLAISVGDGSLTARGVAGIAISATAISVIAAGLALLVPKQGMALTICYLLFYDLPIGSLPVSLRALSVSFHTRVICGITDGPLDTSIVELAIIVAIWGAIAAWRMRRLEA